MLESQAKRLVKHSSLYAIGIVARRITGFIMLPIYTNYLEPRDYGVVGLLVFSITLFEMIFGARFIQAIPKFYHQRTSIDDRNQLIFTSLIVTTIVSVLIFALLYAYRDAISFFIFREPGYGFAFGLFSLTLLTTAFENYGQTFVRLQEKAILFVVLGLLKLLTQLILNIIFLVGMELGFMGVIYGNLIASVIFALIFLLYIFSKVTPVFNSKVVTELFIFSWPLWISGLAGLYIGSSNRFFLGQLMSLKDVGLLVLASTFAQLVRLIFWRPINQYWQVERFRHYKVGEPASPIYKQVFKLTSYIIFFAVVLISLYSKAVLYFMSNHAFIGAYAFVSYLSLAEAFMSMTVFLSFPFFIKEKTLIITYISYLTAAIITILYLLLIPKYGLLGASMGYCLASITCFSITYCKSLRYFDMKIELGQFIYLTMATILTLVVYQYGSSENIFYDILLATILLVSYVSTLLVLIMNDPEAKQKAILFLQNNALFKRISNLKLIL